jgi:hypothetical protein
MECQYGGHRVVDGEGRGRIVCRFGEGSEAISVRKRQTKTEGGIKERAIGRFSRGILRWENSLGENSRKFDFPKFRTKVPWSPMTRSRSRLGSGWRHTPCSRA